MKKVLIFVLVTSMMLLNLGFVFATSDPDVTIVSPGQNVSGNSLLVSVKLTAPKTIKVNVYEEKEKVGDQLISVNTAGLSSKDFSGKTFYSVAIMPSETFESTDDLQFYNKQFNDISPGVYRIKVEVLDKDSAVTDSSSLRTIVTAKENEAGKANEIFQPQQTGALQWVQNFFKSIFKN